MRLTRPALLALLVTAALATTADRAEAQYTWSGAGDGQSWLDELNWEANFTGWGNSGNATQSGTLAIFGTGATEVQLSGPVYAYGITIDNSESSWSFSGSGPLTLGVGGITVSGDTTSIGSPIILAASQTWNIGSGGTLALYGGLTEAGGVRSLIKSGAGTLTLSGTSSYTGTTTVSGGELHLADRVSLYEGNPTNWTATNITVSSGGTLTLSVGGENQFTASDVASIASLASNSTGFHDGAFLGLSVDGDPFTYSNTITDTSNGSLGLVKLGGNTLILTGTNTFTGTTKVLGGTLQLGNDTLTGSVAGNIENNSTLVFSPATGTPLAYGGNITGSGLIRKEGAGILTLSGSVTTGEGFSQEGGIVYVNGSVSGSSYDHLSGVLRGSGTISTTLTVANGATVRPGTGAASNNLTLESDITFVGGSTLAIDLADTSNSQLVIAGGTLDLSDLSPTNKLNIHLSAVGELTPNVPRFLTIIDANGGTIDYGSGFEATHFSIVPEGFAFEDGFTLTGTETGLTIAFTPVPVPEPAAVLGVAVGALAVGGFVRRRWRKPAEGAASKV